MEWENFLKELFEEAVRKVPDKGNLLKLADLPTEYLPLMVHYAGKLKLLFRPKGLEFCSIVNAKSGACSEDCAFCAQSRHFSSNIPVYNFLDEGTLIEAAKFAYESGSKHFSMVLSGKAATDREVDRLVSAARKIKELFPDLKLCFSAGTLTKAQIERLKEAGFERLHHNLETSERFFPKIVSTHSWRERYETLLEAKEVGMETCSGGIFGLGETWEDRAELALTLRELKVDSIPLNFLIPIKGTPLEDRPLLSAAEALKIIALFRFTNPRTEIRLAGGRERVLGDYLGMVNFMVDAHMVGGYLTRAGRDPKEDLKMVRTIGLPLLG